MRGKFKNVIFIFLVLASLGIFRIEAQAAPADGDADTEVLPDPESIYSGPMEHALSAFFSSLDLGGYLKNETAYRYHEPRSLTKIRNTAYLEARYPINTRAEVQVSGWYYYDLVYDLYDYDTISARSTRQSEEALVFVEQLPQEKDSPVAEIRELYADIFLDTVDVRFGRQFVVWGVLEGNRVVDEINPMDFRELINLDLLDYRIPLWTLKVDYFRDDGAYQFLWIPELKFHKPAPPGSEWELLQQVPNTSFPESFTFENSEFGVRYSVPMHGAEVSFSYFYTWDDFPVIFRSIEVRDPNSTPVFFPTYTRIHMFGGTYVKQLGGYILKGEVAYVLDKYFGILSKTDRDNDGFLDSNGEVQKNHLRWGLGVDFNRWGADISPAIVQWIIPDYDKAMIQGQFDTSISLFVRKPLPERSAVFQLLAVYLVNLSELYTRPEITFNLTDRFQISTGMDLFSGKKSKFGAPQASAVSNINVTEESAQFFGNFDANDRLFVEFKYGF